MSLTDDPDYIVRRNGYSLLAELMPEQTTGLTDKAITDADFTVRLTGYNILSEYDKSLFLKRVTDDFLHETSPEVREFLLEMLYESGTDQAAEILLKNERDPYLLKAFGKNNDHFP